MKGRTKSSRSIYNYVSRVSGNVVFVQATYKCEEITPLIITTAVEVVSCLHPVIANVGSRVANRNLSIASGADVLTHVTSSRLDKRRGLHCLGLIVDNFVTGEEGEGVGVFGKFVNGSEYALQINVIVGRLGVVPVDRVFGVVHVKDQIDSSIVELLHTRGVVL